ncbi:putative beta-lysine N-acetyltransferase [Metabacillus litoralis]|uniref:putative beta-lysine N-acetyltransferase n=1 Tax=Metabacillus litoralis TaxID=152268 RepID=UPI001CFEDD51|nr:putative beta-lysine N-acetyltransferase [Metabacillus litoralis]
MKQTPETRVINTEYYYLEVVLDYFNERIRIDHYRGNMTMIVQKIDELSKIGHFTKVIFYCRPEHWRNLLTKGFELEAIINGFFNGTDNFIMTSYRENSRRKCDYWLEENEIINSILTNPKKTDKTTPNQNYFFRQAITEDSVNLAKLYKQVFAVYPTPMNDPQYVKKMIDSGTIFYVVEENNQLVSAASAEINETYHNAELTDCATLPEHRKYGLMKKLLVYLEGDLKSKGIFHVYSIARALSYGMNAAFYQLGYIYNGRLTNNCYIFNKLENMNVWVKNLSLK